MHQVFTGLNRDVLKTILDNSIDSLVTDPPYAYKFMGKKWDYELPSVQDWKEILRVLKPGAHALVACGTRTQHRMAVNLEDAGFEIRDVISWIYGSGFPKSMNIGKAVDTKLGNYREVIGDKKLWGHNAGSGAASFSKNQYEGQTGITRTEPLTIGSSDWEGWGTALKPACEFWTLCRKPISEKTIADNVLAWGVGGINIEECRVGETGARYNGRNVDSDIYGKYGTSKPREDYGKGRFPANLIHDGSEEVLEYFPDAKGQQGDLVNHAREIQSPNGIYGKQPPRYDAIKREESETSAARFFYCAKASKKEREAGLDGFEEEVLAYSNQAQAEVKRGNNDLQRDSGINSHKKRKNTHPTVKPIALMRYLCRLITPKGGTIIDPYAGSGSTGCAAAVEGFNSILIEQDPIWKPKIEARIEYWENH